MLYQLNKFKTRVQLELQFYKSLDDNNLLAEILSNNQVELVRA